jgi:hypothetical protein
LSFFFFSIGSHDEVITKWFNKYETHLKSKGEKIQKKENQNAFNNFYSTPPTAMRQYTNICSHC